MVPADQMNNLFTLMENAMEKQKALIDQLSELFKLTKQHMDEQDQEEMDEQLEEICKITTYCMEMLGHLMMVYGS